MTLFESKPYDPAAARRKRMRIMAAVVVVIMVAALWWIFRFWPEEHLVDQFFDTLQQQSYEKAYGIWMHDLDWKQHPERYSRYRYDDFLKDWGPGGEWGVIKTHKIDGAAVPDGYNGAPYLHGSSGVVVVVTVNDRVGEKARLWVEKNDETLGFSPY
jgi:hypothetical protein